jgi:hypothetical protein
LLTQKRRIQLKDDRFVLLRHGHSLSAEQMTKLRSWGDQFPLLGAAWEAKERFFACWNTNPRCPASWMPGPGPSAAMSGPTSPICLPPGAAAAQTSSTTSTVP